MADIGQLPTAARPNPTGFGFRHVMAAWWGERPLAQLGVFLCVGIVLGYLGSNLSGNMERVGISPGFAFFWYAANFEIGESPINYAAGDSYGRAILVGLLNTVKVAAVGCVLATILGVALGVARLSHNRLLSGLIRGYIELVRNTPLLLQLFFWNITVHMLPGPRQAFEPMPGVLLSNRGVFAPALQSSAEWIALIILALLLLIGWVARLRRLGGARLSAGVLAVALLSAVVLPLAVARAFGVSIAVDWPRLEGFNIAGGLSLSPEFAALVIGLVVNSAAGVAETVRAGILSVPTGQWEAGQACGLSRWHVLRLIVVPQALRVIVPVMTSNYLSLTKNSSLAVAIGFPDLVSVLNTTANTTGQALETIAIMMLVYLSLSLGVSVAMNGYNRRLAMREAGRS
ncbi:general L-amino acid transport system permease protein [Rhodopseudomonas rhenobacensis]|uniref:General L-amino acid transport system permease protein n=1 Tax=Rhodopseudomonas rhenobacensis TaxID=87461 RepID=A0A7W8DY54_9BRAD|nr:ABC transporter permease subunit [Rhodopseudomonas rhenobacensis]MBB5046924.1 general L-amino acid transport system permease protein [Rhodopseudomonas rhenobacensis]